MHATCAQSSTRYVSAARRKRLIMAPIYDMANHERECPHTINPYEDSTYLHIIAGRDVEAGEEVRKRGPPGPGRDKLQPKASGCAATWPILRTQQHARTQQRY